MAQSALVLGGLLNESTTQLLTRGLGESSSSVLSTITLERSLGYRVLDQFTGTRSTAYGIIGQLTPARSLAYGIIGRLSDTRSLAYGVLQRVGEFTPFTGLARHDPDGDSSHPLDFDLVASNADLRGWCWHRGYWRSLDYLDRIIYAYNLDGSRASGEDITMPATGGTLNGLTSDGENLYVVRDGGTGPRTLHIIDSSGTVGDAITLAAPTINGVNYTNGNTGGIAYDADNQELRITLTRPTGSSAGAHIARYSLSGALLSGGGITLDSAIPILDALVWYAGYLIGGWRGGDRFYVIDLSDGSLRDINPSGVTDRVGGIGQRNNRLYVADFGDDAVDVWDIQNTTILPSRSLGYRVLDQLSPVRSLAYSIIGRFSIARSLKYDIRNTMGLLSHPLAYRILQRVGARSTPLETATGSRSPFLPLPDTTMDDISSAEYNDVSLDVSNEESFPTGMFFTPDGTGMFTIGVEDGEVDQYELDTPWDITTAEYNSPSFTVGNGGNVPAGNVLHSRRNPHVHRRSHQRQGVPV